MNPVNSNILTESLPFHMLALTLLYKKRCQKAQEVITWAEQVLSLNI